MSLNSKFYFLVFLISLAHAPLYAGELDQEQQAKVDYQFFKTAKSTELTPPEKYEKLSTLLAQKANIAGTDKSAWGDSNATALYHVIQVSGSHKRDDNDSIKLLIDSKSPLNNSECSVLGRAIIHEMYPVIQMLVAAHADLNKQYGGVGKTCLHQIADPSSGDIEAHNADKTACKIFDILKQHGNLPVDNLTFLGGFTALHFSRHGLKPKPNLTRRLLTYGANPCCPPSSDCACHENDDAETRAIHEAWKAEANRAVLVELPVAKAKNIVMDYCFWNSRLQSK